MTGVAQSSLIGKSAFWTAGASREYSCYSGDDSPLPQCYRKGMPTLFEKICSGEIPAEIVHEDEYCVCFRDITPQAPSHLLLVPRKAIVRLEKAGIEDQFLLGHLMLMVGQIAREQGFDQHGFRMVINNGPDAGEAVPHLHLHILAGRRLDWPPG